MHLHFAEPKTAAQLIARMTEVEKCTVRNATNDDRLQYLREVDFKSDNVSAETMREVKVTLDRLFAEAGESMTFGRTWLF